MATIEERNTINVFWIVLISIISISSFVFSILTLCYLKFIREHRKASSYSFINLLCINIVQASVTLPCFALKYVGYTLRRHIRDPYLFTYLLMSHASTFSLLLMSIDRVVTLRRPLTCKNLMSKENTWKALVFIWLLIFSVDILPFFRSDGRGSYYNYNPSSAWTIVVVIFMNVIPVVVLTFSWVYIVRVAMHHHKRLYPCVVVPKNVKRHYVKRMKATRVTIILLTMYIVCFGPSSFYHMLEHSCHSQCFPHNFFGGHQDKTITFYLKMLNFLFMLAPPVIFCWNQNFVNYLKARILHLKSDGDIKVSVITTTYY